MAFIKEDIVVILPCRNEADNLEATVATIRGAGLSKIVIAIDPATTDNSAEIAQKAHCDTVMAPSSGYDWPMQTATRYALKKYPDKPFLYTDAGNKFSYEVVDDMLNHINEGYKMVMANRIDTLGAMRWHQKLGTSLVLGLINRIFRTSLMDIGPFRMTSPEVFKHIEMQPRRFRWTTEMLVKVLAIRLPVCEVGVRSKKRLGASKISGNIKNSLLAGYEMLGSLQFVTYKGVK